MTQELFVEPGSLVLPESLVTEIAPEPANMVFLGEGTRETAPNASPNPSSKKPVAGEDSSQSALESEVLLAEQTDVSAAQRGRFQYAYGGFSDLKPAKTFLIFAAGMVVGAAFLMFVTRGTQTERIVVAPSHSMGEVSSTTAMAGLQNRP